MDAGNGFYSAAKVDQDAPLIDLYGLSECPGNGLRLSGFVTYDADAAPRHQAGEGGAFRKGSAPFLPLVTSAPRRWHPPPKNPQA